MAIRLHDRREPLPHGVGVGRHARCHVPPSASSAWRAAGPGDAALDAVRAALDDDLDAPTAIAAIDAAAAAGQGVSAAAALLGIDA